MGKVFLKEEEVLQVRELKKMGILRPFSEEEVRGRTKNGGVAILCGDGDIDARGYHKRVITNRPHSIMIFGGPIIFAKTFKGYDGGLVDGLARNMGWGRVAKETSAKFLYPHWPCGVGGMHGYTMIDVLNLMIEVEQFFKEYSRRVYSFFHVAKKFADHEEQNTYELFLPERGVDL
ncbi:MAG TPA: hypothetical protein PKA31_00460 [Candidatus Moranbacteria bacterium]|nr:hypothetical protein [Candidatus Moranbacteria bacterium]